MSAEARWPNSTLPHRSTLRPGRERRREEWKEDPQGSDAAALQSLSTTILWGGEQRRRMRRKMNTQPAGSPSNSLTFTWPHPFPSADRLLLSPLLRLCPNMWLPLLTSSQALSLTSPSPSPLPKPPSRSSLLFFLFLAARKQLRSGGTKAKTGNSWKRLSQERSNGWVTLLCRR